MTLKSQKGLLFITVQYHHNGYANLVQSRRRYQPRHPLPRRVSARGFALETHGQVVGFSILGFSRFRKERPFEAEPTASK